MTGDVDRSSGSGSFEEAAHSATFTDDEYQEYFLEAEERPAERNLSPAVRMIGVAIACIMFMGGVATLIREVATRPDVREPIEIEEAAWDRVGESRLGWLVEEIIVVPIDEPQVGAFVTNNPPDGIIQIDRRPWTNERLDRLVDHEIGHLLEFAVWHKGADAPEGIALERGGLAREAWAECAAVDAGTRRLDSAIGESEYHCVQAEFDVYRSATDAIVEVCKPWGDEECHTLPG